MNFTNASIYDQAIKDNKFITTYKGQQVKWSNNFFGNQSVPTSHVQASKAAFSKVAITIRVLNGVGVAATISGGLISIYNYSQGDISKGQLSMDLVMTGVAFVPVVGWIMSGGYFIGCEMMDNINNSMQPMYIDAPIPQKTQSPIGQSVQGNAG